MALFIVVNLNKKLNGSRALKMLIFGTKMGNWSDQDFFGGKSRLGEEGKGAQFVNTNNKWKNRSQLYYTSYNYRALITRNFTFTIASLYLLSIFHIRFLKTDCLFSKLFFSLLCLALSVSMTALFPFCIFQPLQSLKFCHPV